MSFRRILKPYRIFVSEKAVTAGFPADASFANKAQALAFVKEVQKADPDFKPLITTQIFRYEDTVSGKLYRSRLDYALDQEAHQEFVRQDQARRQALALVHEQEMDALWKSYEPIFEAHRQMMAELEQTMPRIND